MAEEQQTAEARPKKKKKKQKGKVAKKKMPQAVRLEKAMKWLDIYEGQNVLKDYRKKFAVDRMKAIKELQLLGLTFTPEQIAKEKQAVEAHIRQEQAKKVKRRSRHKAAKHPSSPFYEDQDDRFYFIAGYSSGGAPYGVTWEEMGLSPWESPEE